MVRKALNPITLATIIVIMYITMPILSVFISAYVTTYAYMLLAVILISFIMLTGGLKRLSSILYIILPFIVYVACTYTTRGDSVVLWGYQSMLFLLPVIIGYYFLYYRPESINILTVVIVIAVFITVITTIIGLIQFPMAARILATIAESDDPENLKYSWHNIGGYEFVYTIVLLYPLIIHAYKRKRIPFLVSVLLTLLVFTVVILSEYAIAFLFILITTVLFFFKRELTAKGVVIFAIIGFIFVVVFGVFFSYLLKTIGNMFSSETIRERLIALSGGTDALETFDDNRIWLYRNNIDIFLHNPLFGTMFDNDAGAAGHSQILITLAHHGILGGMALFFMYRCIYRSFFRPFRHAPGYGYYFLVFVEAIMLSSINTGFFLFVLTFCAPILFCSISDYKQEEY